MHDGLQQEMAVFHENSREGTLKNLKKTRLSAGRVDYIDFDTKAALVPAGSPKDAVPLDFGNDEAMLLAKKQQEDEDHALATAINASLAGAGGEEKEKVDIDTLD